MNSSSIEKTRRPLVGNVVSFAAVRTRAAQAEGELPTLRGHIRTKVKPTTIGLLNSCHAANEWAADVIPLEKGNQGPSIIGSGGRSFLAWRQCRAEIDKMQAASPGKSPQQDLFRKCEVIARYKSGACRECSDLTALYLLEQMRCGRLPADTIIHQVKVKGVDHAQTLVGLREDFSNRDKSNIAVADPWIETPLSHTLGVGGTAGFQMTDEADFDSGAYSDTGEKFLLASFGEAPLEVGAAFVKVEEVIGKPCTLKGGELAHLKLGPSSERLSLAGRAAVRGIWTGGDEAIGKKYTKVSYCDSNEVSVSFDSIDLNRYFNKSRAIRISNATSFFMEKQEVALPAFDTRFDYKSALEQLTAGRPRKLLQELSRTPEIASVMFRDLVCLGISSRSGRVRASTSMLEKLLEYAVGGGPCAASARKIFTSIVNDAVASCLAGREDDRSIVAAAAKVLSKGVSPRILQKIGCITPLYTATLSGDLKLMRDLCSRGESGSKATADGDTPLALALRTGHSEAVKTLLRMDTVAGAQLLKAVNDRSGQALLELLDYGANADAPVDADASTALHAALKVENYEATYILLRRGASPFQANGAGRTAVHFAAMGNDEFIVADLVRNGGSVDRRDGEGASALHLAATLGNAKVLKSLLNYRADVNAKDGAGNTPLHLAVRHGHHAVIEGLLARKADLSFRNADGKTPIDVAVEKSDAVAMQLLGGELERAARRTAETV